MNSFKYLIPLLVAPILSIAKTANIKAYGLQISLEPTTTSDGTSVFFSTYDGNSGSPLGLSSNISNGEFKPQSRGSSIFVADYAATDGYKIQEYGTVSLDIPSEDLDSNGVHDWLQKENSVYKMFLVQLHYIGLKVDGKQATILLPELYTGHQGQPQGLILLPFPMAVIPSP